MNYDALSHEARELALYTMNTEEVYRRLVEPAIRSLARHMVRSGYNAAKAVMLWKAVADRSAALYAKEFCSDRCWFKIFSVSDRKQCAAYLEETERGSVCENVKEVMK